jgi:hypothetical protein
MQRLKQEVILPKEQRLLESSERLKLIGQQETHAVVQSAWLVLTLSSF